MGDETLQLNRDVAFAKWSATIVAQLEHVVAELAEHSQQQRDQTEKLSKIATDLATQAVRLGQIERLDKRVHELEKNFWKAAGVVSFIVTIVIPLAQWGISLLSSTGN